MRIPLIFILIFSFFWQTPGTQGSIVRGPAADKNKPVLRLGYEEKPKLNAPPKKPLPDITEYYGETGVALQALNMESAKTLEDSLLQPLGDDLQDPLFKRYREYLYRGFVAGLSRAQMILIVRNQLPAIIQSYSLNKRDTFSGHFYDLVAGNLAQGDRSDFSNYKVFFEFDTRGRFQVEGIEPNRLAVNTGSEVYFNIRDIAKMENFTVADAVQLWLHEILHIDKTTPLETRDAWIAKVTQWVREQTTEIQMTPERNVVALMTPEGDYGKMESLGRYPEEDLYSSVRDRFLIFEETQQGTKVLNDIYGGFTTFDNSLNRISGFQDGQDKTIQLPLVTVEKIRKTTKNTLQIEYRQQTVVYRQSYQGSYLRERSGIGYSGLMNLPGDKFRIEWNAQNSSVETSRSYSLPLAEGDFEIYRVKDVGEKRFVSLRVKTQDLKSLLNADSLHLIAKGKDSSQLLSFELKQLRVLNKDEILIHVLLPQKTMEISQILMPETNAENAYSEISLRPSRPLVLQGRVEVNPTAAQRSVPKVHLVSVQEKNTNRDELRLKVQLADAKAVKGLTIDLEHHMQGQTFALENGSLRPESQSLLGLGRKYYLSGSQLKVSSSEISLKIPEVDLTKHQVGPRFTQRISSFYTRTWQDKLPYLLDTQRRRITALWVHFADGSVEKVPVSQLPPKSFSFVSKEKERERSNEYLRRMEAFDLDLLGDYLGEEPQAPSHQTCEGLF